LTGKRMWIVSLSLLGAVAFTALILLASPFLLQWMGEDLPIRWGLVGTVSQSFTGTSAALAAVGLFALAVSILLQTNQLRLSRGHLVRDLQFRMLELALKDEVLADTYFQFKPLRDFADFRRVTYIEMRFRYLEFLLSEGFVSEESLRYTITSQLFSVAFTRAYWNIVSDVWGAEATTKQEVAFVRIMNEEHAKIGMHSEKESAGG
jgi:Family of unknown function (DUF6082)